jgi:hypothetical protein
MSKSGEPGAAARAARSQRGPYARLRAALLLGAAAVLAGGCRAWAEMAPPAGASAAAAPDSVKKLPPEQLQSLVAPVALYPDDLLANVLVASTYPLEIVQLQQWLAKNSSLKDKALADAVAKQPWDASIQSLAAVPEVSKRLADDIAWTTDLGNAFLAQQAEVMDAVQVMRKKAKDKGALESNEQQKVETKVVEQKQVIVVESANPEVVYVPSYSPTVVYGPPAYPAYPYPPVYYPYYPPGAALVSFGIGMMWGAAIWGGGCCGAGWGGNNIYINNNNNFNKINNIQGGNRNNVGSGNRNNWQHNPKHRGGAPYGDQRTADRFGGNTRGAGVSDRSAGPGGAGAGGGRRDAGAGNRPSTTGQGGRRDAGVSDRGAGASAGSDRVGNREIPRDAGASSRDAGASSRGAGAGGGAGSGGGGNSGFSGGSRGFDGASARASGARGASSMGSRGGMSRGGGGRRR